MGPRLEFGGKDLFAAPATRRRTPNQSPNQEKSARLKRAVYRLRNARPSDRPGLFELAQILNTLNLPPNETVLQELLEASQEAFSGGKEAPFDSERHFTFVLEDPSGKVVGTSALHAQHGTPDAPHTFFRVEHQERCTRIHADTPQVLFRRHVVLQLERTFDGPTEVGGLVLSPECRGTPGKLGTLLSLGRFLFVALRRAHFRAQMLAEVLPPLSTDPNGEPSSVLWDALGAKFTGLRYDVADKLSRTHLDLIPSLFPDSKIYAELLPQAARDVIGVVGESSKGAAHLLRKIGFRESDEVDPFDGGPHLHGETDQLAPIAHGQWARVKIMQANQSSDHALIAHDMPDGAGFRALRAPYLLQDAQVVVDAATARGLEVDEGGSVWVWPETALGQAL